jgi:hypothetical protein
MNKRFDSERPRRIKERAIETEKKFAKLIGGEHKGGNEKTDVTDLSNRNHSVKSEDANKGEKGNKWQIFLYNEERVKEFKMNGIGKLLIACIKAFPEKWEDYDSGRKNMYKNRLQKPMIKICNKLKKDKKILKAFLGKSIFNGLEVHYLTIKYKSKFHILFRSDVLVILTKKLIVENSKARASGQMDNQKVIFKYDNLNLAELEMRNDSDKNYRKFRFNMIIKKAIELLLLNSNLKCKNLRKFNEKIVVYGKAIEKFG